MKKHPFAERAKYWFDNKMSQGFWSKVRLLLLITLVYIVVIGLLAELVATATAKPAGEAFVRTAMYVLGKGGALTLAETPWPFFVLMLMAILYCMFFTAILIGLINNALRSKVEELGKGQSRVLESGHTLVLGFNESTMTFIEETIEADKNQVDPQPMVILGEQDRTEMMNAIHKRFGKSKRYPKTRIICRTGSIFDFDDLMRCSITTCRVIVICAQTDLEAIKAIMACSHILDDANLDEDPYIVVAIHDSESISALQVVGHSDRALRRLEMFSLNEVLARIMVHTSRQPGLSDVFTELFNYLDDEFYIFHDDPSYPMLYGKTVAEINHYLQMSYAVGVLKPDSRIVIAPPHETVFEQGDSLIVVKEDDDALQVSEKPGRKIALTPKPIEQSERVNVLSIGVQPILNAVLLEYAEYLEAGSRVHIADPEYSFDSVVESEIIETLEARGIEVIVSNVDANKEGRIQKLLEEFEPHCVLVLADQDAEDAEAVDGRIIRTLLYLRDYRKKSRRWFSITSEMRLPQNKKLVEVTEPDDFIIGRHFSVLLMAQIAQNRNLAELFRSLLSSEGFEVYMKPASYYIPLDEPVDLISVGEAVANKNEVFIGVRQKANGRYRIADINPDKYEPDMETLKQYVFGPEDYLVVLADGLQMSA